MTSKDEVSALQVNANLLMLPFVYCQVSRCREQKQCHAELVDFLSRGSAVNFSFTPNIYYKCCRKGLVTNGKCCDTGIDT